VVVGNDRPVQRLTDRARHRSPARDPDHGQMVVIGASATTFCLGSADGLLAAQARPAAG
jgi:hypothetical protein